MRTYFFREHLAKHPDISSETALYPNESYLLIDEFSRKPYNFFPPYSPIKSLLAQQPIVDIKYL